MYAVTPIVDYHDGKNSRIADRGAEIGAWLEEHKEVTRYCIPNDDPRMLPEQLPYWVRSVFHNGFTQTKLEKALRILSVDPDATALPKNH